VSLVIWIFIYALLLLAIRGSLGRFGESRVAKVAFLPGFLAALIVRGAVGLVARAPVKSASPPWRVGPPIVHGPPALACYGSLLFGVVPVAAGAALLLGAASALGRPVWFDVKLEDLQIDINVVGRLLHTSGEILREAGRSVDTIDWRAPDVWLFLYAATSVHLYLAPRLDECRPLAAVLAACGAVLAALDWLGFRAGFLSRGWYIKTFYGDRVWDALTLLVATALLGLLVACLAAGGATLARALRGGGERGK
jgi:hypothetical protein